MDLEVEEMSVAAESPASPCSRVPRRSPPWVARAHAVVNAPQDSILTPSIKCQPAPADKARSK